ncbi:MAG: signal peptidase I [Roseateles sp.]
MTQLLHLLKPHRGFIAFLLGMALLRTAVADWNPIPSGSMRPTLLEGDVVLVNRLAYDLKLPLTDLALLRLAEPRRGDVVTFRSPLDGTRLIKRIVGLPGDRIALQGDTLLINGSALPQGPAHSHGETLAPGWVVTARRSTETLDGRMHALQTLPSLASRRDLAETVVPAGHYFMLGDNRDNSADSRVIGPVPRDLLIGRAHRVLVSADWLGEDGWRLAPRLARWGMAVR